MMFAKQVHISQISIPPDSGNLDQEAEQHKMSLCEELGKPAVFKNKGATLIKTII